MRFPRQSMSRAPFQAVRACPSVHRRPTRLHQWAAKRATASRQHAGPQQHQQLRHGFFSSDTKQHVYRELQPAAKHPKQATPGDSTAETEEGQATHVKQEDHTAQSEDNGAWQKFTTTFQNFSVITDQEWRAVSDKLIDLLLPEWSKFIPGYIRKLQGELSMAPGSLADEIWREAHDPGINPEIRYSAKVRVSNDLCDEEKEYLARRKKIVTVALAKYLGLDENEIHEDDVPTIAVCGSGGGLRALVAGIGSMIATGEDGLFDCVTYTSGVSGSCWLQALFHSTFAQGSLPLVLEHLKARLGVHIAYPPVAFSSLASAPTNRYLLSGLVEKLRGDPNADFGLVDIYGILLAARLLVPRGELGVDARDFKLSNQRQNIKFGQNPFPIYTAVRHEIPNASAAADGTGHPTEKEKEEAAKEAWFQWFEITPYEAFCEEFAAGIPTWALGRKFANGRDVPPEEGFHLPEARMPLLLGIFGSAFCATLSHYYREVRPLVRSLTGFSTIDEMVTGHNDDLSKVHPIDPAMLPNFTYGMEGQLPRTTPTSIYKNEYLQLMDAGMSNNLPIYPLLRPGRNVDILIAFDASADVKTDNWLSVADGYARQRGIKGWPIGIGWPKETEPNTQVAHELSEAEAATVKEASAKLDEAKAAQTARRCEAGVGLEDVEGPHKFEKGNAESGELGYCTVWVGTTQERSTEPPPPSKALDDSTTWQLQEPDAGIAVVYLPFLKNDKVEGVDPGVSEYLSTWNFVYTPEQIDKVVQLAKTNYDEGKEKIRRTVRAVYERRKKMRLEREGKEKSERRRRRVQLGVDGKLGEGDHFS
ncbi:hypothetical protein KVR01_002813 [Diaporthe batatas]|uniref:uncharacterized protein n=1 Tax=Diaporthe batatas TaxID=748121 RepID=UPI001D049ACC|nr:uncharacterized protein KVR01_002813 [Diaporthe batatas]KAG8167124.1 hypothetical protein KVR01_002813 [Diaporthe batatas]